MKCLALIPLAAGVLFAGQGAKKDTAKEDLQPLQGTWTVVSQEMDGRKVPADTIKPSKLTVKGDKYTVVMGDKVVEQGTFKIDASKTPKTIDATPSDGEHKGQTFRGIYEIKGDTAKDCFAPPGKDRPTDFVTKQGSGLVVRVYQRVK